MPMTILPGPQALSNFRVAALVSSIDKVANSSVVTNVRSCFVHYVDSQQPLDHEVLSKLQLLLKYDNALDLTDSLTKELNDLVQVSGDDSDTSLAELAPDTYLIRVIPRSGTISPWSSKATNIVEVCGLGDKVARVERGTAVLLQVRPGFPIMDFFTKDSFECLSLIYDRMTQSLYINDHLPKFNDLFESHDPKPLVHVDVTSHPEALTKANKEMGLALDDGEISYLLKAFKDTLGRDPTDIELFMFAQVNSEHCRHKIFNADWTIDGVKKDKSLFGMIRNTHKLNPQYTVSAYSDNAAIYEGTDSYLFYPDSNDGYKWKTLSEIVHTLIKVETHNHPTAVSPFPGAATGSGGEIRDEAAVGRGSKTRCGLAGFIVSDLVIPGHTQEWELDVGRPSHISSPLEIMIEAPLGSAAFNNEFGRPSITGFFRTYTVATKDGDGKPQIRGFHKPIMLAGGLGSVRPQLSLKSDHKVTPGAAVIVLGGPSMLIGLGGGAASSVASGEGSAELDFASVQRGNPEIQRRAQQVINTCNNLGLDSPIQCIHDVGAGGLSNALPELVYDNGLGAKFELRNIPSLEKGMSPMELWCNESQERYVLAVATKDLDQFKAICDRERCPFAVVGTATSEQKLIVTDKLFGNTPIDLDMSLLFGKPPKMSREDVTKPLTLSPLDLSTVTVADAVDRVLNLPAVGSKSFLITIGDRSVTGVIDRDQFVGPWQVPVSDVGVCATTLGSGIVSTGDAMATGERPALALISPASSAKMCIAESLMNLFAADVRGLNRVKLSANWMSSASTTGEGSALYEAVQAVGMDLCPTLGIEIPVGKDSMSMRMSWEQNEVISPLALVVTAFCGVNDTSNTWTPVLQHDTESVLVSVDLAAGKASLGGSALAQVYKQLGDSCPSVDSDLLKSFLLSVIDLHKNFDVLAYHDRSDGGILTTLLEMAFAGRCGISVNIESRDDVLTTLFNEELGAVFQIKADDYEKFVSVFAKHGIPSSHIAKVGKLSLAPPHAITIDVNGTTVFSDKRSALQQTWTATSYALQKLRDNPQSADQEYQAILDDADPGITYKLTFDPADDLGIVKSSNAPKVAILREQGVNSDQEMAWCFQEAGFTPVDVHMTDIILGRVNLSEFQGIAACGGFSYGDVLGAGNGWAKSVLYNAKAKAEFKTFFEREDTFALGSCNGCQFLSQLKSLIPGCESWPTFEKNASEQFEGRVATLEVAEDSSDHPCIFFDGMRGSRIPTAVAHGEGRATFESSEQQEKFVSAGLVAFRYVDNYGVPTEKYPLNPNGSTESIAGIRSPNGRVLAVMPHPERVCRLEANSYYPPEGASWGGYGPWIRLFRNARIWTSN